MPSSLKVEGSLPRARLSSQNVADEVELGDLNDTQSPAETETLPVDELSVKDERIYLATLCLVTIAWGWNDGSLGPLLPRIQSNYNVSHTSLLHI